MVYSFTYHFFSEIVPDDDSVIKTFSLVSISTLWYLFKNIFFWSFIQGANVTDDTKKDQDRPVEPEKIEGLDKIREDSSPEGEPTAPEPPFREDESGEKPLEPITKDEPVTGPGPSLETPVSPKKTPRKTPPKPPSPDGFKPHYKKEARLKSSVEAILFAFLFLLGAGLIALGLATFINGAPFRLEVAATVIICLALLGFLRKTISIEVMVGLAAAAIGLVLGFASAVYGTGLDLFGAPSNLVLAVFFCLCLAALLIGVWLLWPRFFWAPIAASVIVLYAAIAPVWTLLVGLTDTTAMLSGPSFLNILPIFIRPGYLMAQLILPLGVLLFLVLQVRILARPQYAGHWGFIFWSICLLTAVVIGLTGLERGQKPVYPKLIPLIAKAYPVTIKAAAKDIPIKEEPALPEPAEIAQPVAEEKPESAATPDTEPGPATTGETESAGAPPFPTPDETDESSELADVATPIVKKHESDTTPAPKRDVPSEPGVSPKPEEVPELVIDAATLELHRAQLAWLEQRVETLESEVDTIKQRMEIQDRLIRALFDWLSTHFGFGMGRDSGMLPDPSEVPGMPMPMLPMPTTPMTPPETEKDDVPEKPEEAHPGMTSPEQIVPEKQTTKDPAPSETQEEEAPQVDESTHEAPTQDSTEDGQISPPADADDTSNTGLDPRPESSGFLPDPDLPRPERLMLI
jgi:hypothetical protein